MASQKHIVVDEDYQTDYHYDLTEPIGKNFAPDFKPDLTPKEMLELGVFGGAYFSLIPKEFPQSWFIKAKLLHKDGPCRESNYFGVHASQSRAVWQAKGWIHSDDPLGWFLWYCRYYMGRRHVDDARQIQRWRAYRRHLSQVGLNCRPGDMSCRRKQRQSLLHWAYDARKI
jgi:hypothetical protein